MAVNEFDMDEIMKALDQMDDEDDEDFSFMDYMAGSNPESLRERLERKENTPSALVGGSVVNNKPEEDAEDDRYTITDEVVKNESYKYFPTSKVYRSMLLELFTPEQCIEIEKLTRAFSISTNQKIEIIKEKLTEWGIQFSPLGGGTNRWAFMHDGYVVKIACDEDGKIDNTREYIYSMQLQPYVIKCYECFKDGLMAVFEYVEIFTNDEFWKNQNKMREILRDISQNFLIGDVGISTVNYSNWGFREDGSVVILDFAYIYAVAFKKFECGCTPGAYLAYDNDFNNLICPYCGTKYSFKQIRKKISMNDQKKEIGDLFEKGYILSSCEEEHDFNPKFVIDAFDFIKKKLLKALKKGNKINGIEDKKGEVFDKDVIYTEDEILEAIKEGKFDKEEKQ